MLRLAKDSDHPLIVSSKFKLSLGTFGKSGNEMSGRSGSDGNEENSPVSLGFFCSSHSKGALEKLRACCLCSPQATPAVTRAAARERLLLLVGLARVDRGRSSVVGGSRLLDDSNELLGGRLMFVE